MFANALTELHYIVSHCSNVQHKFIYVRDNDLDILGNFLLYNIITPWIVADLRS